MFDRISPRYDLLNRVLSFCADTRWRAQALDQLELGPESAVIDLGVGTGDLAFRAARRTRRFVVGVDISEMMMRSAIQKSARQPGNAAFVLATGLRLPFLSETFDAAMTAFVLRNVSDLGLFFREAHRVLKTGGRFLSIEMFRPTGKFFAPIYLFYFYQLIPLIGGLIGTHRPAYRYLAESLKGFETPDRVTTILEQEGFREVRVTRVLGGAVCFHLAMKA
jgi:demethylmenaquinone methyltransferase/2-methoxy-6-polyprenyl-1,4-benzoquinol methylase